MIPRDPTDPYASFGHRLGRFFQLGLALMEGDTGALQETIKSLASEGGLLSIRELIERHIPLCRSDAARLELWRASVRPLFSMLAEKRVTNSTLLEMSNGAIYNALFGYNASRLQPLCDFLLSIANNWRSLTINDEDGQQSQFLELCTSTLAKIVDCNTQALVNDAIPPIVQRFKASLGSLKLEGTDFWILQADKNMEYIRRRLSVVKGIAQPSPAAIHSLSRASFIIRRDLPGELSAEGPRHDNDHADCTKIRILPTMSEILSTRQDYRPFYDPSQLHLPGLQGLIDRHFRLLRDDMVGQLKESISYELARPNNSQNQSLEKRGIRTHSYHINAIIDVTCTRRYGLEFHLQIEQPFSPDPRSKMDCEEYWAMSRRLETGALVCVLQDATAIFCVVSDSTVRPDPTRQKKRNDDEGAQSAKRSLYSHRDFSYVNLCLAEPQKVDVEVMIRAFMTGLSRKRVLVEFPGILLPSFQSTLLALQHIYKTADLPFSEILAPDENTPEDMVIPPPLYSTKLGFAFNLKSITNNGDDLVYSPLSPPDPDLLMNKSQLDRGQAVACLNTLRRAFQVIQGPPGTGKSWTGEAILKVLLDNRSHAQIGPILCVCYTNHALDQLLEHLWNRGITQIIRIGSRSKSTLLEDVNLRKVAREVERTRAEKQEAFKHGNTLTNVEKEIKSCLHQMNTADSAQAIQDYLIKIGETALHNAIFGAEAEEGWTKVTYKDENELLRAWVYGGAITQHIPRPLNTLRNLHPNMLSQQERQTLYRNWITELLEEPIEEFVSLEADHRQAKKDFENVHREIDLRVLSQCQVIGVTTTGLAKNLELLRKIDSKVLLCEEAGEVLESHILTALLPSLEHVILIGDHLQLRPQVANYELSVNNPLGEQYSLDVSLFERLVKPIHPAQPKLPFDTLTIQRRMHPSISNLIRKTIYSELEDAGHLSDYPEVVGMRKRLFWFDHNHLEGKADATQPLSTSHTNEFEVEMVAATVSHLVRQGVYSHNQIAVLTPYLGQLHQLRKRLRSSFEIVLGDQDIDELDRQGLELEVGSTPEIQKKSLGRCLTLATVDNFQGEEAEVIVISLVRSNPDGRCGFLKTSNRINVLLSRAKHGMYIFGNSTTYANVRMWSDIISMLKAEGNFGTKLPLQCPRHKDKAIEVGSLDDFVRLSPEAGCNIQCAAPCNWIPCSMRCTELLACGHQCPSLCGEICPEPAYCQVCASEEIKSMVVDMLEMKEYREIDLDTEPCIFPDCMHVLTVTSMDGQLGMSDHYEIAESGQINGIKELGDAAHVKSCPTCRGSLRNISRYGRLVRQALLEESTKKFITWSHNKSMEFESRLLDEQGRLDNSKSRKEILATIGRQGELRIAGQRLQQLLAICEWVGYGRYDYIIRLYREIVGYLHYVRVEEQPYQRVHDLVQHARRHGTGSGQFLINPSKLETRGLLLAGSLLLRCDLLILKDFMALRGQVDGGLTTIIIDLQTTLNDCNELVRLAREKKYVRHEAEGHIYFTQFVGLVRSFYLEKKTHTSEESADMDRLRTQGEGHLAEARVLLDNYKGSTLHLVKEFEAAESMLKNFRYAPIGVEEKRAIWLAMSKEFSGTGHWYACENGHPFTVGECGMPMEQTRCPECGAPVGGQNHTNAAGVQHDAEMDALGTATEGLRL
ncbi:hypothetical protein O1611_g4151 [Lasiodiplodia mahajangana]|uniref:Uncharacterized protein n=1 Tax=Lasiodiplodia mahajangana TaxID=1108764 RepID=A0ACC2JPR0_9PEZI|nr:hypothetical protein O1611_g4151 [Lasiodiplodia mahajangana]